MSGGVTCPGGRVDQLLGEAAEIGRVTLERLRSDPADYLARDLVRLEVPAIVYRAVGKYREDRFRSWLEEQDPARALTVFVGSSAPQARGHLPRPSLRATHPSETRPAARRGRDRRATRPLRR